MCPGKINVLFLSKANSARSIMAEAILNAVGAQRFRAFSAGSHPSGTINPHALRQLQERRIPVEGLHSKSWDGFAHPHAPGMHFVFSVCDSISWHACPTWSGIPMAAHWGLPDPAVATGSRLAVEQAFAKAYKVLYQRIGLLIKVDVGINLPVLQLMLDEIGRAGGF